MVKLKVKTSRPLPNLIIAGVHKAGTTSVFSYLSMHAEVCASRKKELGFFIPARYDQLYPSMNEYSKNWKHYKNEKYIVESTPSYLYGKEKIATAVLKELGKIKIIFILRDPIERLYSFYKFSKMQLHVDNKMSFEEFIDHSHTYEKGGIRKSEEDDHVWQGIIEGIYVDFLKPWHTCFGSQMKVLFFDDLQNDTEQFMRELCEWLEIDFSKYKPENFTIENKTIYFKNKWVHKAALKINHSFERFWRKNFKLKKKLRSIYYFFMERGKSDAMDELVIKKLNKIYTPYNQALKEYLQNIGIKNFPDWLNY